MRKSGVIMELNGEDAVVMAHDGEFCRVKVPSQAQVGSIVDWDAEPGLFSSPCKRSRRRRHFFGSATAAGLVAAFALAVVGWRVGVSVEASQPYANVALDISPGVQMTVNRNMRVISASPMDVKGNLLLASVSVNRMPLGKAVTLLVGTAADKHMIRSHDNILVATSPVSDRMNVTSVSAVQNQVNKDVNAVLKSNLKAAESHLHVYSYEVSDTVWTAAEKLNVSPAKVAAYISEVNLGYHYGLNQLHQANLRAANLEPTNAPVTVTLVDMNPKALYALIQEAIDQSETPTLTDGVQAPPTGGQVRVGGGGQSPAASPSIGLPVESVSLVHLATVQKA